MAYYNKLRDNLRKDDQLPDDMSWADMEDGILQKMGKKEKKRRFIVWWLFPIAVLIGLGVYQYGGHQITSQKTTSTKKRTDIIADKTNDYNNSSNEILPIQKDITSKEGIDIKNGSKSVPVIQKSANSKKNTDNNSVYIAAQKYPKAASNKVSTTIMKMKKPIIKTDNFSQASLEDLAISKNSLYAPNEVLDPIASLKMDALKSNEFIPLQYPEVNTLFAIKNSTQFYFGAMDLALISGITIWNRGSSIYQPDTEAHSAAVSEKPLPSYFISLQTDVSLTKTWGLKGGIEFQKWYSAFDYDGSKSTTKTEDDVIIKIEENILTGDRSYVRGTALIKEKSNRALRHKNVQNHLFFNISPTYRMEINHWSIMPSVGMFVGVFTSGSGKMLWQDDIVSYNGKIPNYNDRVHFGYKTSLSLKYTIQQKYFVNAHIDYQKFVRNVSADAMTIRPSSLNVGVGLGLHF